MLDAGHHHGAAFFQQRTFLDAVAGSIPVQVSAHNGMMAVAMGLAAEISAREHRVVRMDKLLR